MNILFLDRDCPLQKTIHRSTVQEKTREKNSHNQNSKNASSRQTNCHFNGTAERSFVEIHMLNLMSDLCPEHVSDETCISVSEAVVRSQILFDRRKSDMPSTFTILHSAFSKIFSFTANPSKLFTTSFLYQKFSLASLANAHNFPAFSLQNSFNTLKDRIFHFSFLKKRTKPRFPNLTFPLIYTPSFQIRAHC